MRKIAVLVFLAHVLFLSVSGMAATLPGSIGDDYLNAMDLERVSVGFNFEDIQRYVDLDGADDTEMTLDATSYSLFLGFDIHPWLTAFGTLGLTEDDSDIPEADADEERLVKWSLGLNANLYDWDFRAPRALMGDRLTIKCFVEYADYSKNVRGGEVQWNDLVVALPIAFDRYERNTKVDESELFRLSIYAGPMISLVEGTVDYDFSDMDFQESESLGLVAGVDIYFTSSFSLGGQVQMFDIDGDDIHARASGRYHF